MPTAYKVLGQNYPSAATATTLYTVPASTSTVVSSLTIQNLSATASDLIDVSIRPAGETLANKHYILKNIQLASSGSLTLTIGMTLATTDVVTIYSVNGTTSFNLFGSEIS